MFEVCSKRENFAQHLLLSHVEETNCLLRLFNAHVPTVHGTAKRKEETVQTMCRLALKGTSEAPSWAIGGTSMLGKVRSQSGRSSQGLCIQAQTRTASRTLACLQRLMRRNVMRRKRTLRSLKGSHYVTSPVGLETLSNLVHLTFITWSLSQGWPGRRSRGS